MKRTNGGTASRYDLIVVGGGPAGTSAAITAARAGAHVLLLERGRLPRHRVCGEFVSAESLGLLASLLVDGSLLKNALRIGEARLFAEGRMISIPVEPPGASVARFDLDVALWAAAVNAGVDALEQTAVESVTGEGPFFMVTAAGECEVRAIINASGRWSNLSRETAVDNERTGKWLGLKAHFAEDRPPASTDLYFFDRGYLGVQPVRLTGADGEVRINVCAAVRADVANTLESVFEQHPQLAERARGWQALMEPVSTSPLIFREPQPEKDGMLMAGDAAAFVDPFVGDGISLALRSGALAAQCLAPFFRGEVSQEEATLSYRTEYQREFLPVFRNSSRIRQLLGLPKPLRTAIAWFLEATPGMTRYMAGKTR